MIERLSFRSIFFISVIIIAVAAVILFAMGRVPWYEHGPVRLWSGDTTSDQNSQQITDPYTFTHVIHGIAFYFLLWLVARRLPARMRLVIAVFLEALWEIFENTPFVLDRYRAVTISYGYYGDSIINSLADIATAAVGFYIAFKLPWWVTLALVVFIEGALMLWIRDNLILNILMLVWPIDAVRWWQLDV